MRERHRGCGNHPGDEGRQHSVPAAYKSQKLTVAAGHNYPAHVWKACNHAFEAGEGIEGMVACLPLKLPIDGTFLKSGIPIQPDILPSVLVPVFTLYLPGDGVMTAGQTSVSWRTTR